MSATLPGQAATAGAGVVAVSAEKALLGAAPPSILHYCRRSSHTVLRRQRGMLPSTLHLIYIIKVAPPLQNLVYAMDSDRLTATLLSEVMLLIS